MSWKKQIQYIYLEDKVHNEVVAMQEGSQDKQIYA